MQYDLHLCDGADTYTCDTYLVDSTGATDNAWNTDDQCSSSGNWVMLDAVAYSLETADMFTWEISGLSNPESVMMSRTAATAWDFDATDTTLFGEYEGWTEKFDLFIFDSADKGYSAKSYGNLNAAYLGFNYMHDQILVNGGSTIQVFAGSYTTDKAIAADTNNGMMAADKVTLTPSNNTRARVNPDSNIAFQSMVESFVFFSEANMIHFRVGANIDLSKGIYFIDWSITETQHNTNNTGDHYHAPAKTKVEVVAAVANKYTFAVEALG